jgi:hypothetical protein
MPRVGGAKNCFVDCWCSSNYANADNLQRSTDEDGR